MLETAPPSMPEMPEPKSAIPTAPTAPERSDGSDGSVRRAPSHDAVFDALEAAAVAAEGHAQGSPMVTVGLDDFRAAVRLDPRAVRDRLDRVVMGDDPETGLDALLEVGALAALFPEVHAMVGFGDGEWRHKDVWKHTKQVVRQAVPRLVLHHLRANQYSPDWTDSAVRRFARELGTHLEDLLCLARADITTKRPEKKRKGLQQIEELQHRIGHLAEEDAQVPPLPSGIGDAIMRAFGLPPSRKVGDVKRMLEEAVQSGEVAPRQESEAYLEFLRVHKERFGL